MQTHIKVKGAAVHNLKNVDVELPRDKLIVFTGLSGSGKSSLAFDTIYAEGQRRYLESLSSYARQFLGKLDKPNVEKIEGLSPSISIDQKQASHNPRSTVGTTTEIYDYLRLLFSSIGIPECFSCGKPIQRMSIQEMVSAVLNQTSNLNKSLTILSPLLKDKKGEHEQVIAMVQKEGFSRIRLNGDICRIDEAPKLAKNKKHTLEIVVDRVTCNDDNKSRLFESIETATRFSKGLVLVKNEDTDKEMLLSEGMTCPTCFVAFEELSHRLFSFNSPIGACQSCNGLGENLDFDPDLVIENKLTSIKYCTAKIMNLDQTIFGRQVKALGLKEGFDLNTPFYELTDRQRNFLLYGKKESVPQNPFIRGGMASIYKTRPWEGIITNLRRRYFQTQSEGMRFYFRHYMSAFSCPACNGGRLNSFGLAVKVKDLSIAQVTSMSIEKLLKFFETIDLTETELVVSDQILKEICSRLSFLNYVGLNYLSLSRKASTLSGGEFQRIRLATQIGAGLTGVLYVLDEPSIGLHQRDNERLIHMLKKLRDLGNTIIVVEHDEDMMRTSDFIVDIGPAAGKAGGHIVFSGEADEFFSKSDTLTAKYLNNEEVIQRVRQRNISEPFETCLTVVGAAENNLKNVEVSFPLGKFVCVTGVSGSGKSTLVNHVLLKHLKRHFYQNKERPGKFVRIDGVEHIDKVIVIDQSAIGRTPRSNPATYTGLFTPIRDLFSQTNEAKIRGYKPGRFSFNVKGGRCEGCQGDGVVKIEMHFLSDVYVGCDVCKGKRYNEETLQVTFKGLTISDVLKLSVNDAFRVFENIPSMRNKLQILKDVGLGYIHLGQNATTLSGGEAQRVKLAKELSKIGTGKTVYMLDEPTTGLHFADIQKLLDVLDRLVDKGNTVIVIEHNLDLIRNADWIIDLGPEGGEKGGRVLVTGTPEDVVNCKKSYTGQFLKKHEKLHPLTSK
ncbi:excinuclease ABC subunit UvrA [bacterium]|nr:excinuclease ABC subunit UvrA [bacterium]